MITRGCADPEFKIHHGRRIDPGLAHIAAAVPNECRSRTLDIAPVFEERLEIGEQLAGMEILGERINHGHSRMFGHGADPAVLTRSHDNQISHA